ncbi:MAG: DUF3667 domain-containing protein [Cyclobacteriaceae bacterium]
MKKNRRKSTECLNCGTTIKISHNYCHECGQENNDNNINFGTLFKEFFSNYFSFDSRFGRSLKPFFLLPGALTIEFLDGKRVKYANPIRWYLVISLFHFFFFSRMLNISENKIGDWNFSTGNKEWRKETGSDSLNTEADIALISLEDETLIDAMVEVDSFAIKDIYDSVRLDEKPFLERVAVRQYVRLNKAEVSSIFDFIVGNVPYVVFLMLPLYALLLKVFFHKTLYIKHLIHAIYIHSFVLFIFGLCWILNLLDLSGDGWLFWISMIIVNLYLYISFIKVYQQKYFITAIKLITSGGVYLISLFWALLFGSLISLLLF